MFVSILLGQWAILVNLVQSHSFMECSDYRGVINGQDYDDDLCVGYPRYWNYAYQYWPDFGTTGGKTNKLSELEDVTLCKYGLQSLEEDYDDIRPYAHYVVGSTIRLLWPAKNHANYECKSYTRDNTMQIYVLPEVNPTEDSTKLSEWELVIDWHAEAEAQGYVFENGVGIDGIPFQNCPDFCDETDNAPCFGDWDFTEDLYSKLEGEGIYTFLWLWEFGEGAYYTTCWEANVTTDGTIVTTFEDSSDTDSDTGNGGTGTDNTGNSDTGSDTDTDTDEEEEVEKEYQFTIPVCYEGTTLDNTLLMNAFDALADKDIFNDEIEFTLTTSVQNNAGNRWNASIQSNYMSNDFYVLTFRFIDNGTLCNLIENEFSNVGACEICGGASAKSQELVTSSSGSNTDGGSDSDSDNDDNNNESNESGSSGGSGDSDSTLILIIIICILVLLIIIAAIYFIKLRNNSKNNSNKGGGMVDSTTYNPNSNANIMATHITQSNIVPAGGDGPQYGYGGSGTGSTMVNTNARPSGPPPVPRPMPPTTGSTGRPTRPPPPRPPVRA